MRDHVEAHHIEIKLAFTSLFSFYFALLIFLFFQWIWLPFIIRPLAIVAREFTFQVLTASRERE